MTSHARPNDAEAKVLGLSLRDSAAPGQRPPAADPKAVEISDPDSAVRGSAAPVADPTTAPQPRIAKVSERQRYELHLGEQLVSIVDYRENDTSVALTRTFTIPPQRGKSYAADLVAFAVDDVERQLSKQVVPVCWYVAEWLEAHPERERTGTADATGTA